MVTIDINKVMEQRKRYHKLYANGMMQEDELFDQSKKLMKLLLNMKDKRIST